jgi:L-ribulose-5-phosphate 3-epimerase
MGILFHTMATPALDPVAAIDLAARLGFDGIELICQQDYRCGVSPDIALDDATALGNIARQRAVPITVLSAYEKRIANPAADIRAAAVERLSRSIEVAAALGASGVRILAGEATAGPEWQASLGWLVVSMRALCQHAASRAITLLVENHMDTMAVSAARTVTICAAIDHPNVGILFDPANLATLGAEDFVTAFELQQHWIRHVHVKDAVIGGGARRSVIPGTGDDPWPALLRTMQATGYGGDYSVEYERRWFADLPEPEIALPRAKQFIERQLRLSGDSIKRPPAPVDQAATSAAECAGTEATTSPGCTRPGSQREGCPPSRAGTGRGSGTAP